MVSSDSSSSSCPRSREAAKPRSSFLHGLVLVSLHLNALIRTLGIVLSLQRIDLAAQLG
jgi:hypothetical protein